MHLISTFFVFLLITVSAQANLIFEDKDWKAYSDVNTPFNKIGCFAETTATLTVDGQQELWRLQVIRLKEGNTYTYPIVVSFPDQPISERYFEAIGNTDKDTAPTFNLIMTQPQEGEFKMVAGRIRNRLLLIRHIGNDKHFTVDFRSKQGTVRKVEFSLGGSFKAMQAVTETCS